jgi:hypothetical protein
MNLRRGFGFLARYGFRYPWYVVAYAVLYVTNSRTTASFYDDAQLQALFLEGKSFIRLGDGEINLLLGLRNVYQAFSESLREGMRSLIRDYRADCPYVLGIPRSITRTNRELAERNRLHIWMPFKVFFWWMFPKTVSYMDAHAFYYDRYFERVFAPLMLDKHVIVVTNAGIIQKMRMNARIPWKHMDYIETPAEQALGAYETIAGEIARKVVRKEQAVLLFGLGPLGKTMMKEYSEKGYQSIDVGRGLEAMFTDESLESLV